MDLSDQEVGAVYWTALLKHVGCTAYAHEQAEWVGGNDNASLAEAAIVDFSNSRETLSLMRTMARGAPPLRRAQLIGRAAVGSKRWDREFANAFCEVAARVARRLELDPGVERGLHEVLERWNGKGGPRGLSGEDIALPARFAQVAEQAILFDRVGGPDAALHAIGRRAGGWVDPSIANAFEKHGVELLGELSSVDPLRETVDAEPEPHRWIPEARLDDVARTFADMADLKSVHTRGHSTGVASLGEAAAGELGLSEAEVVSVRRAGLLHDLGRVGVPAGIWEKPAPLSAAEWEQVRLHPYHTERILSRSSALRPLAALAGMHHERQDGSGYHRAASGATVPAVARVLAAADAYQAMTQERAHRPAFPADDAAKELEAEASAGRFDPGAARAVLAAAGYERGRIRRSWPAGLSEREVQVLDLVARGLSTKDVGERLFISPKTVGHHVEHIYAKLGVTSRAALAMFAMEHDLFVR
jgi:HD-GYP domain-containing protein (c-di-GMP phosphodiesterase class II)